jgi:hypothetical protein
MMQSAPSPLHRNVTCLSFVAFKRSIKADFGLPRNRAKLSVRTQMLNGRTDEVTGNIERFDGMRTSFH